MRRLRLPIAFALFPTLGLQSWQEQLTLTARSGASYHALAVNQAVSIGSTFLTRPWQDWEVEANASMVFGSSSANNEAGTSSPPINYAARSIGVTGGQLTPSLFWRPASRGVSFGLALPLLYRVINYPDPGGGYDVSAPSSLKAGVLLDTKFQSERWVFSPKMGFLGALKRMMWSIQIGYRL